MQRACHARHDGSALLDSAEAPLTLSRAPATNAESFKTMAALGQSLMFALPLLLLRAALLLVLMLVR